MNVKTEIEDFVPKKNGFSYVADSYRSIEYPSECPYCNKSIFPNHLTSLNIGNPEENGIASIFICNACKKYIFTINIKPSVYSSFTINNTFPIPTEIKNSAIPLQIYLLNSLKSMNNLQNQNQTDLMKSVEWVTEKL